jgi:hypothetical protein
MRKLAPVNSRALAGAGRLGSFQSLVITDDGLGDAGYSTATLPI